MSISFLSASFYIVIALCGICLHAVLLYVAILLLTLSGRFTLPQLRNGNCESSHNLLNPHGFLGPEKLFPSSRSVSTRDTTLGTMLRHQRDTTQVLPSGRQIEGER